MTTLTVTNNNNSTYTVTVAGGPATPADWVAIYLKSDPNPSSDIKAWQYMNGTQTQPATGLASATLTFQALPVAAGPYQARFLPQGAGTTASVVADVPVVVGSPAVVSDGFLNLADPAFGGLGIDPGGDDTAALQAIAAAAKAQQNQWGSKGVLIPAGFACNAYDVVDFTGIDRIKCDGWLIYRGNINGPSFKFGWGQGGPCEINIKGAYCNSSKYFNRRHPLLQFKGIRNGKVRFACPSFVEILGDDTDPRYYGTAWSDFSMGSAWVLEIRDDGHTGNAWINSNVFRGGQVSQLRLGGPRIDVVGWVSNGNGTVRIQTAVPHNFTQPGTLVEMYNGNQDSLGIRHLHGLVTPVDLTHFDFPGAPTGSGWWCMGPPGYRHNDNDFWACDLEDNPAFYHMQGSNNRLRGRNEFKGDIIFGPEANHPNGACYGNRFTTTNSTHGAPPSLGDRSDQAATITDYSGPAPYTIGAGLNFVGYERPPGPYTGTP